MSDFILNPLLFCWTHVSCLRYRDQLPNVLNDGGVIWVSGTERDTLPTVMQKSEVIDQVLQGLTLVSTRASQAGERTHALSFLPVTIPFYFEDCVKFQIFLLIFLAYFEPRQSTNTL